MPGYVRVNMDLTDESWSLLKGTPGVTGFVGASDQPIPLTQAEVDRLLHREVAVRTPSRAQFAIGESVKVISGPLSDFSGRSEEHTSELQSRQYLVCRLLLEKKKKAILHNRGSVLLQRRDTQ